MANSVPSPRSGDLPRGRRSPSARPRLAGFAGATFIVASNLAGWWGAPQSPLALAPFAAMFGGLAQFMAGMWGDRARRLSAAPPLRARGPSLPADRHLHRPLRA